MNSKTSSTLHVELTNSGSLRAMSDDMVGLHLESEDPSKLGAELGAIIAKAVRRRLISTKSRTPKRSKLPKIAKNSSGLPI